MYHSLSHVHILVAGGGGEEGSNILPLLDYTSGLLPLDYAADLASAGAGLKWELEKQARKLGSSQCS